MTEKKRILLVDDDKDLVEALKVTFEKAGFDVAAAYSGEDGLKLAREKKPDLIVLDVMMGGEHGFNVCKELKGNKETSSIAILIFSAMTGRGDARFPREIGMDTEADNFLEKPLKPSEVLEHVKELLARG